MNKLKKKKIFVEKSKDREPSDWSVTEQKALEKGLQSFPSTLTDRWERIAETIPGRTKKECIQRYKYIVEQIKQKKSC